MFRRILVSCTSMNVRPSSIAGQWYPADPERLRQSVEAMLEAAPAVPREGKLIGLIAPHAGHIYSGRIAARAFRLARGLSVETVAVVSPMHFPYAEAVLTTGHEAYGTPLGVIPVDKEAVEAVRISLRASLGEELATVQADPEHSLEIELPFLQLVLGTFKLLPVMLRDQSVQIGRALGEALAAALKGRPALLVGSSDLSHFYQQREAEKFDRALLERVEAFDPQGVMLVEEQGKGFACGRGAIAAVLWAAQALGATRAQVVGYGTSGDITGDFESVVGYGAAAIWRARAQ